MKHDFNTPTTQVIPHIVGMPCECIDCMKNANYTKQLSNRNAVYENAFDFPDWNDLKLTAQDLLAHATNNPVAISAVDTAKQLKKTVKSEVNKVNSGGTSTWKNLPLDKNGKAIVPNVETTDVYKPGQVSVDWLGWTGPLKWVLIAVAVIVITAVFLRIKGHG